MPGCATSSTACRPPVAPRTTKRCCRGIARQRAHPDRPAPSAVGGVYGAVTVKRAVVSPVTEPLISSRPRAETFRQITPGGSGAEDPEDAVEHQPIITSRSAHLLFRGNEILDQLPARIWEFVAPCHVGHQPIMAAILPVATFRTEPSVDPIPCHVDQCNLWTVSPGRLLV